MVETNHNSSDIAVDSDLPDEDSWVVIKKQKVTILIPSTADITNAPPQLSHQKPPDICLADRDDDVIPRSPESDSQFGQKVDMPPKKPVSNPRIQKMDSREHNFEDRYGLKKRSRLRLHETAHNSSMAFGQPGQSRVNLPGCTTIPNNTLRASNIKIKIVRAGGLRRWLSSLGLEQFERIFRCTKGSKYLWGNLSMGKLKEMGYLAVGPRRKLIHAIECLY